jgi:hypothetical protein
LTSFTGSHLPAGRVVIRSKQGTVVYEATVTNQTQLPLPYGDYTVDFKSDLFKPVRRAVKIDKENCFAVLATEMEDIILDVAFDSVAISVRVHPSASCAANGFLWARLMGVFSQYFAETKITQSGFGLFDSVPVGTYIVVVIDEGRVRAAQPITTKGPVSVADIATSNCEGNR